MSAADERAAIGPTGVRTVAWFGLDDPGRFDVARVAFSASPELRADGCSVTRDYVLTWSLVTGPGWMTRSMSVDVRASRWSRSLRLVREDGGWRASTAIEGSDELPEPGIGDPSSLADAVDCDLGLCPATNAMPILRLGLTGERPAAPTMLPMALIEIPALRVVRSEQTYELLHRHSDGRVVVGFAAGRDFRTQLDVDPDGIVTHYPGLAVATG